MTRKARVVFEGIRGKGPSAGGFSLDDINLSSGKCPQHIWHVRNITHLLATTPAGRKLYSPRFLSPTGYSFQVNALYRLLRWAAETKALSLRKPSMLHGGVKCENARLLSSFMLLVQF